MLLQKPPAPTTSRLEMEYFELGQFSSLLLAPHPYTPYIKRAGAKRETQEASIHGAHGV